MAFEVSGKKLKARRNALKLEDKTRSWSQEGVAARAGVDRRTYGDMERNIGQRFEAEIIRYVCTALGLEPSEVIISPDSLDVKFDGPKKIDFRPARDWSAPNWQESRVIVALDNLGLTTEQKDLTFELRKITLTLPQINEFETFTCKYLSSLVPGVGNHLGIQGEFVSQYFSAKAPTQRRAWSFKSGGDYGISWSQLNERVKALDINVISILVNFELDRFSVKKTFRVSLAQWHAYMKEVERNGQTLLKFVQLEVLDL